MSLKPDFTWKPGTVVSTTGRVPLKAGQQWGYYKKEPVILFTVISTSTEGEVLLRPADPQQVETVFPEVETVFKGKPTRSREGCPFKWVDDNMAKGSKGQYKTGDLLVHEAWTVWADMGLHAPPEKV